MPYAFITKRNPFQILSSGLIEYVCCFSQILITLYWKINQLRYIKDITHVVFSLQLSCLFIGFLCVFL